MEQTIGMFYKIRQPGESFTPDQWMRTVIKELWVFSITIWKQRNSESHGTAGAISMEQRRKDTANEAVAVYQSTIGKVSPTDVLCCTMLASRKFSNGRRSTWTLISPLLMSLLTNATSRVNFKPSWAASLYALWIGSCMVMTDVVF